MICSLVVSLKADESGEHGVGMLELFVVLVTWTISWLVGSAANNEFAALLWVRGMGVVVGLYLLTGVW